METKKTSKKVMFALKSGMLIGLSAAAFNVSAYCSDAVYLGNPDRPDTVWQPASCVNGCPHEGYFIKFINQPTCRDVRWDCDHFRVPRYVVVNPGSEQNYPGVPQ